MAGSKFHYPVGNPDLTADEEIAWRTELMNKALRALQTEVAEPTVF
jgi:glycine reductase